MVKTFTMSVFIFMSVVIFASVDPRLDEVDNWRSITRYERELILARSKANLNSVLGHTQTTDRSRTATFLFFGSKISVRDALNRRVLKFIILSKNIFIKYFTFKHICDKGVV